MRAGKTAGHRRTIINAVTALEPRLPAGAVTAAVDTVLTGPAAARELAAAVAADPDALTTGAPPVVGRLVDALRERGSQLPEPACAMCAATGRTLTRSEAGALCRRCWDRQHAAACARCGVVKLVRSRDAQRRPLCGRCADRPQRICGRCGRTRRIARRAHDGQPDVCDACFRMPEAICSRCQRRRPCGFATGPAPVCASCAPRASAACAHCGQLRPPAARWPEGPVCDPCYTAALRRRGTCSGCGQTRRLVEPPGPAATICADCAGQPVTHACIDCGVEDKLYERGRCNRCALRRRTEALLRAGGEQIPAALAPVYEAIIVTGTPRTALNWLRNGAGAKVLAELATGRLACTHEALDTHPRRQAADYLRHMLVANGVLPARDEQLAATDEFLTDTLAGISRDHDRRLVHAYATWRVMRRLRRSAERAARPRSYTRHARANITAAVELLNWLADRGIPLPDAGQDDVDTWLTGGPARYQVRDFLLWTASAGHAHRLTVPTLGRNTGPTGSDEQRWAQLTRLLHDDQLDLTDRVAGALLLLYGQQLSRIAAMTTDQVITRQDKVFVRFGRDDVHLPEPLAGLNRPKPRPRTRRAPLPRRRLTGQQHLAVPRPATRPPAHRRPPRRALAHARHPRPARAPLRHDPPRRPSPGRRARQPAQPRTHHRSQMGSRRRRRLVPLRRRTRPQRRSPTMTNAPRRGPNHAAIRTVGTLPLTSLSAGANVKAVQRMLGHASAALTLDRYADLFDDDLDAVADRLDAVARTARGLLADSLRTGGQMITLPTAARTPTAQ